MVKVILRRPKKKHSLSYRCFGLSVLENMNLNYLISNYKKMVALFTIRSQMYGISVSTEECVIMLLLGMYISLAFVIEIPERTRSLHESILIETFSPRDCHEKFGFEKPELHILSSILLLDNKKFILYNGSCMLGEEMLLLGLYRFHTKAKFSEISCLFKRDNSILSCAFNIFVTYIIQNFGRLVSDSLKPWIVHFPVFAEAIRVKLVEASDGEISFLPNSYLIFGFYDDTVLECCRPGAGPRYNSGQRNSNDIQRAFYNGWKKHHGFKYQTLELPNGMCADLFGPRSFRRNDIDILQESQLNTKLRNLQVGHAKQYKAYGDGIFPIQSHLIGKHIITEDGPNMDRFKLENRMMTKMRISNEWSYGFTGRLFPLVKDRYVNKIRLSPNCAYWYIVATILRNLYVCLYGNISCSYFNLKPPDIYEYFRMFNLN